MLKQSSPPSMAEIIVAESGQTLAGLSMLAAQEDFQPIPLDLRMNMEVATDIDRFDAINVVALLPGTGDSNDTVLFTAHHDHFGICRPEADEDQICNGAVDNASGTAALLETARGLASIGPNIRDILFVTTTAEEEGLLGAQAFLRDAPMSRANMLAVFNLDMSAIGAPDSPVGIIGRGMTDLDPLIDRVAREQGRAVYLGTEVNEYVERNDAWAFLRFDVPAVMAGGSFTDPERLTNFLRGRYHRPEDESDGLDLRGALSDTLLHIALGRAFADPSRYPRPGR